MTEVCSLPSLDIEIEVPFADIDAQRIVWHGNYFRYFELARTKLLAHCGLLDLVREGDWDFVVADSHCRHYHPLRFGDHCTISSRFVDIDHRLNIQYEIHLQDGTRVAKGHTHLVTLDRNRKLQLVTPDVIVGHIKKATSVQPSRRRFLAATGLALTGWLYPRISWAGSAKEGTSLPTELRSLLKTHKEAPGISARFVEYKHFTFLKVPLKNEGQIAFCRPGLFARLVEKPKTSHLIAQGDRLTFIEGDAPPTKITLTQRPELQALVLGILFLLAGDEEQIERRYALSIKREGSELTLTLVPRDEKMRTLVTHLTLRTAGSQLKSFEVHERSGDFSVTELNALNTQRHFSDEEKKRLFLSQGK